jgi:hypothetical protein
MFVACSDDEGDDDNTGNGTGATGGSAGFNVDGAAATSGSGNNGSGTGGTSGSGGGIGPNDCPIVVDNTGCAGEVYVGENIPLDIYVMFDQSGSMLNTVEGGMTRMAAVQSAVSQFLQAPESSGIGVGIGYFGHQPIGSTTCDQTDYEAAAVDVGLLPGNAQAVIDSLNSREPTGETPSGAAIRGACKYATDYKIATPGHEVVILLVTDGEPKAPVTCGDAGTGPCCPTIADAVDAAQTCLEGDLRIKTYVLGVGPFLENLGQIAVAGGTDMAYLVGDENVTTNVLQALNDIRAAAAIPCELEIPPPPAGDTLDLTKVNVVHTTNTCETQTIFFRETSTGCTDDTGGWYFDDPAAPTKVQLCGKTCNDVSIPGGQLMFSVGCDRVVEIR